MKGEAANEKMASIYRSDIAFVAFIRDPLSGRSRRCFIKKQDMAQGRMQKEIALVRRNGFSVLMIIKRL